MTERTEELHTTASEIRQGDVFTLHTHERTALHDAWPVGFKGHVYIPFVGGGGATAPAGKPLTVTRSVATA
ncbi:hypothetical protein M2271_003600 [Streptomyces sp. LBL]|uniref:hypothetical protein n=1 Tax=Streptomyces sp. LBL TaxID=2940562 RepID=UPI0024739D2D|nr:hypothetical protein [Streptomyces sp. LBL]MDH6625789.1 hypothetical protein [Streptomyces sp. LBL]